jgi:hypothetical protein
LRERIMQKHWTHLPLGPNVGKTVKLAGITRHGKNRIHEKGDMWKVTGETDKVSFKTPAPGPFLLLEALGSVRDERWVSLHGDPNFEIVENK